MPDRARLARRTYTSFRLDERARTERKVLYSSYPSFVREGKVYCRVCITALRCSACFQSSHKLPIQLAMRLRRAAIRAKQQQVGSILGAGNVSGGRQINRVNRQGEKSLTISVCQQTRPRQSHWYGNFIPKLSRVPRLKLYTETVQGYATPIRTIYLLRAYI